MGLPNLGKKVSLVTGILPQQLASLLDGFFTTELDKVLEKGLRSYLVKYFPE